MKPLKQRVEERIRDTICKACVYEKADGGCGLSVQAECPILGRVDQLIEIVRTTDSADITPYAEKLREAVCRNCVMEDAQGQCALRKNSDCALDDYFVLIVDLIEQELAAGRGA